MACQLPSLLSSATLDLLASGQGCPLPFVVLWQYGSTSIIQGISFYTKYFGGLLEQGIHGIQQLEREFRVIGVAWVLSACSAVSNQKSRLNVCLPAYLLMRALLGFPISRQCLWAHFTSFFALFFSGFLCMHIAAETLLKTCCALLLLQSITHLCLSFHVISLGIQATAKKHGEDGSLGHIMGDIFWATFDNCLDGFHHNSWD